MALPTCKTIAPDGLTPHGAFLNGKCITNGGSQAQLRFAFLTYPKMLSWQYTSWQDVEEGETVNLYCPNLSYISTNDVQCQIHNSDGYGWGDVLRFWLPTPTKPAEGAPWLALTLAGEFTDTDYLFTMTTDIPCHLHCLVGSSKPWVSLSTHIIRGVVFHHDPELYFKWFKSVTQDEAVDTTTHSFTLPYYLDNVTYWLVARGTVDGKESPSISPPFSYRRRAVPIMDTLDAYGITDTSAWLPGILEDDQGAPAYVRHHYTKVDTYDNWTPVIGPYSSKKQFNQLIDSLDGDTEYKYASMGSHDHAMERYGWSYPKYFRTLEPAYGPEQDYECPIKATGAQWTARDSSWSIVQTSGLYDRRWYPFGYAGVGVYGGDWFIKRDARWFDTSSIPVGAKINDAYLHLNCMFSCWPSSPCRQGTFQFLDASSWDGTLTDANYVLMNTLRHVFAQITLSPSDTWAYRDIPISSDDYSLFNPGATFKFAMMEASDVSNIQPESATSMLEYRRLTDPEYSLIVKAQPPL